MRQTRSRQLAVPFERSAPQRLPVHPDAPRTSSWRRWALGQGRPRAVDLFTGCGGLSTGLEKAGYSVVLSVDNDPWCVETHRHNLPGPALNLDLSDPERIDALVSLINDVPIDLVAGGPPCQPFSRAGRAKLRSLVEDCVRPERDERKTLWQAFLTVVERVRPAAVMMENVPDMALGDDLSVLRVMTGRLEAIGYDVDARLLDAWRHGVPQHRQRLILVALRDGQPFRWPRDSKRITLRDAIGDLPSLNGGTGAPEMKARKPVTAFQKRARVGMNGHNVVWDHVTRAVRDDDKEAFRLLKPGMRYGDLPKRLRRYRSDIFNDKYNRLDWKHLSRSITAHIAKDGYWYIHPSELRTLTVREAARIQTFPDRFRFAGSRSHAFRQIGNAVPPALGEAIGRSLLWAAADKAPLKSRRSSVRLGRIRSAMLEWGARDARVAPWRHPGDTWRVLAGVVLGDRVGAKDTAVAALLADFPAPSKGSATRIRKSAKAKTGTTRTGFERLSAAAAVLSRSSRAWETQTWVRAASIGPQDEAFVRAVGLGESRIIPATAILRVVSRLTGIQSGSEARLAKRRFSDGKMAIAQIVGVRDVPALTAALHSLGRSICTPATPECRRCPVRRDCEARS